MDFIEDGTSEEFTDLEFQLTPNELRKLTQEDDLETVTKIELSVDTGHVTLSGKFCFHDS